MIRAVIFDMYETLITQFESPLYYGTQMAADMGLTPEAFLPTWRKSEQDRGTGKIRTEDAIAEALREHGIYSEEMYRGIVNKRFSIQEDCFRHLHNEILPLLQGLKERGVKIGLISNCFSEEAELIHKSEISAFFDATCLSYEEGCMKPEPAIFHRCMERLGVKPEECLYVGDGGSNELETAGGLGMEVVQAVWYRCPKGEGRMAEIRPEFIQIDSPLRILDYV